MLYLQRFKEIGSGDLAEEEPRQYGVQKADEQTGKDRGIDTFGSGYRDDQANID